MFFRNILASFFRGIFRTGIFAKHFYGVHDRLIQPYRLFSGVNKRITYRKNILLDLDIDDWIQQHLYFLGEYEEKEIRFLISVLEPGDVFIDLGANIGLFSLVASSIITDAGKVYAFEPYSENFVRLKHHLQLNQCTNVIAEQSAVSDRAGTIDLKGDRSSSNKGMISQYNKTFTVSETVPCLALDKYYSDKIKTSVKCIKLDIEGGELNAIRGMAGILRIDKPILLIEVNDEILKMAGSSAVDLERELSLFNYSKYYLDKGGRLISSKMDDDHSFNCVFVPSGYGSNRL
ncbi:MAG TPA: FkbM family methyltransferase [Flavitalea sp.]|nr:FkbM family methyltransferase [Flavitalea sp.]